jgi:hypothetical protein
MKHEKEGHKERKHGGRAEHEKKKEHKKRGGKVGGKMPEMRMDKRARGGRMTPSSPLSGAGNTHGGIATEDGGAKDDERASGGRLSASDRNALPASNFALPGHGVGKNGKGSGSYPIPDASHARNALARSANKSPAVRDAVRQKVHDKFPEISQS